eukprot:6149099-Pleurochrysis_carterae.AAC.1
MAVDRRVPFVSGSLYASECPCTTGMAPTSRFTSRSARGEVALGPSLCCDSRRHVQQTRVRHSGLLRVRA